MNNDGYVGTGEKRMKNDEFYKRVGEERITYNELRRDLLDDPRNCMNYRFVEPPLIVYFVTTIDAAGNVNVTPVSIGTYAGVSPKGEGYSYFFTFTLDNTPQGREGESKHTADFTGPRDAGLNLEQVPECVISYCSSKLVEQVRVAGLPIPRGISELDLAGLTPFPSETVRPPGIAECPVNMEAKVIHTMPLGVWTLYVVEIERIHVDAALDKRDRESEDWLGVLNADPIFEVHCKNETGGHFDFSKIQRMNFGRIDTNNFLAEPDDIGPDRRWIGTFEIWMEDEVSKGKISMAEHEEILSLKEKWLADPDPVANGMVKERLTCMLTDIIWERR